MVCPITQGDHNNILSDAIGLLSGVVQGSSIGPILLVIFIDDLIEALQQFVDTEILCR